jgi:hypothetical protein
MFFFSGVERIVRGLACTAHCTKLQYNLYTRKGPKIRMRRRRRISDKEEEEEEEEEEAREQQLALRSPRSSGCVRYVTGTSGMIECWRFKITQHRTLLSCLIRKFNVILL